MPKQFIKIFCVLATAAGCVQSATEADYLAQYLRAAERRPTESLPADVPPEPTPGKPSALEELEGPQPVAVFIRRALAANPAISAARHEVEAAGARIPQVTALDNPLLQSTVMPFEDNSTQTAAGRTVGSLSLSQRFPWFGTLSLRGEAAEHEVNIALHELEATKLDVTMRVKRAYHDLHFNQRAMQILEQNRDLAEEFVEIARIRYQTGTTTQQDVLRAEVAVNEIENEAVGVRQQLIATRATLARLLHVSPETDLRALAELPIADVPSEVERLRRLAESARPELQAQLSALARDHKNAELARKRYYPDFTLGLLYQSVSEDGALAGSANGRDNFGLTVGLDLPIYWEKLRAGEREARSRALADAGRYVDLRNQTAEEVTRLLAEATAQRAIIEQFRESILPRSRQALEVAIVDYAASTREFVTLITVWQELLRIELQTERLESELGKTLADLERLLGGTLDDAPA